MLLCNGGECVSPLLSVIVTKLKSEVWFVFGLFGLSVIVNLLHDLESPN